MTAETPINITALEATFRTIIVSNINRREVQTDGRAFARQGYPAERT